MSGLLFDPELQGKYKDCSSPVLPQFTLVFKWKPQLCHILNIFTSTVLYQHFQIFKCLNISLSWFY